MRKVAANSDRHIGRRRVRVINLALKSRGVYHESEEEGTARCSSSCVKLPLDAEALNTN